MLFFSPKIILWTRWKQSEGLSSIRMTKLMVGLLSIHRSHDSTLWSNFPLLITGALDFVAPAAGLALGSPLDLLFGLNPNHLVREVIATADPNTMTYNALVWSQTQFWIFFSIKDQYSECIIHHGEKIISKIIQKCSNPLCPPRKKNKIKSRYWPDLIGHRPTTHLTAREIR